MLELWIINKYLSQQNELLITFLVLQFIILLWQQRVLMVVKERKYQETKKLQKIIDQKEREILIDQTQLGKQHELIQKVIKTLDRVVVKSKNEENKECELLLNELKISRATFSWREFEQSFTTVHKDFYSNLLRRFPDLTRNERRLCSFLRLNMTTKEISAITLQSQRAVIMARHRLRQKMGLAKGDDIIAFILSC